MKFLKHGKHGKVGRALLKEDVGQVLGTLAGLVPGTLAAHHYGKKKAETQSKYERLKGGVKGSYTRHPQILSAKGKVRSDPYKVMTQKHRTERLAKRGARETARQAKKELASGVAAVSGGVVGGQLFKKKPVTALGKTKNLLSKAGTAIKGMSNKKKLALAAVPTLAYLRRRYKRKKESSVSYGDLREGRIGSSISRFIQRAGRGWKSYFRSMLHKTKKLPVTNPLVKKAVPLVKKARKALPRGVGSRVSNETVVLGALIGTALSGKSQEREYYR